MKRILTLTALPVLVLLSGCSVTAQTTVSPDDVANAAAKTLEVQVGVLPEMDCGSEAIPYEAGVTVHCVLTDPNTGTSYDTTVTLEDVGESDTLGVSVEVSETPLN